MKGKRHYHDKRQTEGFRPEAMPLSSKLWLKLLSVLSSTNESALDNGASSVLIEEMDRYSELHPGPFSSITLPLARYKELKAEAKSTALGRFFSRNGLRFFNVPVFAGDSLKFTKEQEK